MTAMREFFSALIFVVGVCAATSLILESFSWVSLLGTLLCFAFAYLIWPSKKRGQRDDGHWLLDLLEFVIELPIEILLQLLRLIGQLFKAKDGGMNIDL